MIAVIGIDIGKNWFHVVGLDGRGTIALRQKHASPICRPA
jgi:predicted NBD/HSP70 family sugar kinase